MVPLIAPLHEVGVVVTDAVRTVPALTVTLIGADRQPEDSLITTECVPAGTLLNVEDAWKDPPSS